MRDHVRRDQWFRFGTIGLMLLCGVGAGAGLFVALVRVPALAASRLELLTGTLLGVAVSLVFAVAALLACLTYLSRRSAEPAAVRARAGSGAPGR